MHEISLIKNLLGNILGELEAHHNVKQTIKGLTLTLGVFELHSEGAFRQAFAVETQGTVLEGKPLELTIVPAEVDCKKCGFRGEWGNNQSDPHGTDFIVECPECGVPTFIQGGRGVKQIELVLGS